MRIALAALIITITGAAALLSGQRGHGVPTAVACSFAYIQLDVEVRNATFVGVVETTSVGDGLNRAVPLPRLTPPPEGSPTPTATKTEAPRFPVAVSTATATASPIATITPSFHEDLVGVGARASVIEQIGGESIGSDVVIDQLSRTNYEMALRRIEAGYPLTSCGLGVLPKYAPSMRYIVVLRDYGQGELFTIRHFAIEGTDALLAGSLDVSEATYRRYLPGVAADIRDLGDGTGRRSAFVTADRIPVTQLVAMLRGVRTGIAPPDTGNAGLAANR